MATIGQGAPGVRIKLRDLSEVNLVFNPNIVAGVVGHSTRGEFNVINDLGSISNVDVKLGTGFTNPKYNQGLYAARAVINAGGFVEFVRPYGEEIITDDNDADYDTNQKLKTDTFLVQYDFSGTASTDSLSIDYYAATRYITDGMAGLGEREIYTIQEAITENVNTNFYIDSDVVADAGSGTKKIPLFAIMNSDPTSTNRAGDRLDITTIELATNVKITTVQNHGLSVGDSVIVGGTISFNGSSTVKEVISDKIFKTEETTSATAETDGVVFINEDSVTSGVDALQVKTVAAGMTSKVYQYLDIVTGSAMVADGDTVVVKLSDGTSVTYEFQDDIAADLTTGSDYGVEIEQDALVDANFVDASGTIVVDNGTWTVNDIVRFTGTLPAELATANANFVIKTVSNGILTLVTAAGAAISSFTPGSYTGTIFNITRTAQNLVDAVVENSSFSGSQTRGSFIGTGVNTTTDKITVNNASLFAVGDKVIFSLATNATTGDDIGLPAGITANKVEVISSVDLTNNTIQCTDLDITAQGLATTTYKITNLTKSRGKSLAVNSNGYRVDFIGTHGLVVPQIKQEGAGALNQVISEVGTGLVIGTEVGVSAPGTDPYAYVISDTSTGILLDSTIGRNFVSLGLADESYDDVNYTGSKTRVYTLNAEGLVVAKVYLYVSYFFNGQTYNFQGTIIPYILNGANLYIAETVLSVEDGWKFKINENAALYDASQTGEFNLSQTVDSSDLIQSTFSAVSLNANDPAIENDVIWVYNPANNNTATILASAWELFLDKDNAGADMLVSAGTTISSLFVRGLEQINYTVMDAMLNICEKRKDMFCVFDGVDEKKIDIALEKMIGVGGQGEISRWGGIWDGRSLFNDTVYTKLTVEAVKSIEVAAVITLNRASNAFWIPPAGYDTGRIPGSLSSRQKYDRSYNYAEDPNSDIARLYDSNINPTRVNDQGQVLYGQKTMLKRSTALNRMNVIMLVAGIHKRFANYLELKVFRLNTPQLRSVITAELQSQLDGIRSGNPSGLTAGIVICNESNNTPYIIDTNQLIVDVNLQPTRSAEFITLRTTVQRTGADINEITDVTII